MPSPPRIIARGRHLNLLSRQGWEYATRPRIGGIVAVIALSGDGQIVLVEQYRPAVERNVLELPAGLAGDTSQTRGEPLVEAAKRELLEETGYTAARWQRLFDAFTSPGLTDESLTFFLATGLSRSGPGGGDASERITVHTVALHEVDAFIARRCRDGCAVDLKLHAGLRFAERVP